MRKSRLALPTRGLLRGRTNCLFYSLALLFRRWKRGRRQGIFARISDAGPFPHFVYQETRRGVIRQISYKPINPITRTCPPLIFLGAVRWGDVQAELR